MIIFIKTQQAILIHQQGVEKYGGAHGLREEPLLISALEMPKQGFGEQYFHEFPYEMAAAYLFHISKNHPFVDGNKRAAFSITLTFLMVNNIDYIGNKKDFEDLVVATATGKLTKEEIAEFLKKNCKQILTN